MQFGRGLLPTLHAFMCMVMRLIPQRRFAILTCCFSRRSSKDCRPWSWKPGRQADLLWAGELPVFPKLPIRMAFLWTLPLNCLDWLKLLLNEDVQPETLRETDSRKLIPPLAGALLKNEQDLHLFERIAFMARRRGE